MDKFLELLRSGTTLVADGATGTNLQKVGLPAGVHTEEWVLDQPDKILALEKAFVSAGSDILLTCTFGGTSLRMQGSRYADRVVEINQRAVELARKAAAGTAVLVAGSLGPTGMLLKPYGPLTPEEAQASFAEQARALAEAGVDLLVIETHFAYEEADAAFRGVRAVSELPIVVSFSYDRGVRTMIGVKPVEMIKRYRELGAALVGANCGTTLENMEQIASAYAGAEPGFPLWIKPNAGMPRSVDGAAVYDLSPAQMGEYARKFVAAGARVVGGCCGTTPEHIAAIASAVK